MVASHPIKFERERSLLGGPWKVFDAFNSESAVFKRARTILALTVFPLTCCFLLFDPFGPELTL